MTDLSDEERLEAVEKFFREEMIPMMRKILWTCAAVGAISALAFNLLLVVTVAAVR